MGSPSALRAAEAGDAAAALRAYVARQIEPLRHTVLRAEMEVESHNTGEEPKYVTWQQELKLDADGRLNLESSNSRAVRQRGEKASRGPVVRKMLWTGDTFYSYNDSGRQPHVRISAKPDVRDQAYDGSFVFMPLMGRLTGDRRPFHEIMAKSPTLRAGDALVKVGDSECVELKAETPSGSYTVYLDPQRDYVLRRATVVRRGDDLLYGRPMSSMKPPPEAAQVPGLPRTPPVEHMFTLDDTEVKQVEGKWVLAGGTDHTKTVYEDGRVEEQDDRAKITDVTFAPDFGPASKAFEPIFPDGTQVIMSDLPRGVRFHWQGGKPVPTVDAEAVDKIDAAVAQVVKEAPTPALAALAPASGPASPADPPAPPAAGVRPAAASAAAVSPAAPSSRSWPWWVAASGAVAAGVLALRAVMKGPHRSRSDT